MRDQVVVQYPVFHPSIRIGHTFRYYEMCLLGLGEQRRDHFDLSGLVDIAQKQRATDQFFAAESTLPKKNLTPVSLVPTELCGFECLDRVMCRLGEQDYQALDLSHAHGLNDIKEVIHARYQVPKGWKYAIHLRGYSNYENRGNPSIWLDHAKLFLPEVVRLVESLPFKQLGYCMILRFDRRFGTTIHRDSFFKENGVHLMNILLNKSSVPFFVYDAIERKKKYVTGTAFTFNELDLHASDPEDEDTYMLRVDGVFEDWLCEELGLRGGFGTHPSFLSAQELEAVKIHD